MKRATQAKREKGAGVHQLSFKAMDELPVVEVYRPKAWYYLTRRNNSEMLLKYDPHGQPVWVEHDLRHQKPHLFNAIRKAQVEALRLGAAVRSCFFDRNAKGWVNYVIG